MDRGYQHAGERQPIELFNQVEHQLRVRASPAVGEDSSIADIGSDDNAPRESHAHVDEPVRVFERSRSDHHALSAVAQHLVNGCLAPDSSPDLNFRIRGGQNCLNLGRVLSSSGDSIKVNDMKVMEPILSPGAGDANRVRDAQQLLVVRVGGELDAGRFSQVERRNCNHPAQLTFEGTNHD